jgi:DNA mismatch repair ATPase MutL
MLDQHALAERIIFERLSKQDLKIESQRLLIQESLTLTPKEIGVLESYKEIFYDM